MPKPPPTAGPQYLSYRKVPPALGGEGRVCLYDAAKGLPDLAVELPKSLLKACRFVLVHFPSRRAMALKTKVAGLDALRKIHDGENFESFIVVPTVKKKVLKGRPRAPAPATQEPVINPPEAPPEPVKAEETKEAKPATATEIPVGVDFNAAMAHVFPDQIITGHFERLLTAEEPVYDKMGVAIGARPAFSVQFQALKALTEWRQGRPTEQAKPVVEKPKMSYTELVEWIKTDADALEYMETLCTTIRTAKPAVEPVKSAAPPVVVANKEGPATT